MSFYNDPLSLVEGVCRGVATVDEQTRTHQGPHERPITELVEDVVFYLLFWSHALDSRYVGLCTIPKSRHELVLDMCDTTHCVWSWCTPFISIQLPERVPRSALSSFPLSLSSLTSLTADFLFLFDVFLL